MIASVRDDSRTRAANQASQAEAATLVFVPIVAIDTGESRIRALRCLRLADDAPADGQGRGTLRASGFPWDAASLPGVLATVSALPFDLDFVCTVGPTPDEAIAVVRQLASPETPHPIRLSRLVLEIGATREGVSAEVVELLEKLRARCLRLSLVSDPDDCCHEALLRLRPDYLSLPEALIEDIGSDADHQMVVESIAQLAWKLGTQVIAEGVRTARDVEVLRGMGVPLATGAHFRGPLLLPDLVDWKPRIAGPDDAAPVSE
jgi:predicted signal transduction protein with EAL and GGDEF domain